MGKVRSRRFHQKPPPPPVQQTAQRIGEQKKQQVHWLRTIPTYALKTAIIFTPLDYLQKSLYYSQALGTTTLDQRFPNAYNFFDFFAGINDHVVGAINGLVPKSLHTALTIKINQQTYSYPFFPSAFTAAIGEEIFWRGFVQKVFMKKVAQYAPAKIKPLIEHQVTRILVSASFFSLIHMYQWRILPEGPASTFLRGVWYGYLSEHAGLQTAITMHFLWNIFQFKFLT